MWPVLWFHGTDDKIVLVTQAREAKASNLKIELIEIQDGSHRFGDKMQPGEWEKKVEDFIRKLDLK